MSVSEIDAVADRIRHWRRSYENWRDGDRQEADFLAGLASRRYYIDSNAANLSAAVHAIVVAHIATGGLTPIQMLIPPEGDETGIKRDVLIAEVDAWLANAVSHLSET